MATSHSSPQFEGRALNPSARRSAPPDGLSAGQAALARCEWAEARRLFEEAAANSPSPEVWEGIATAASWQQDADVAIEARQRAYRLFRASGDGRGAARAALWLANDSLDLRGEAAVANGWLARAKRLLEAVDPCPEHVWLTVLEGHIALMVENDPATARARAGIAERVARAAGHPDGEVLALALEGLARVTQGEIPEGMACLDEAVAAATGGDLTEHHAIAATCCYMIHACERVRDFPRAGEWCRRLHDLSTQWQAGFYLTICRLQYSSVLLWRGDWPAAELELDAALRDLAKARPAATVAAYARLGELRRRQGRWEEAEELFERSRRHRWSQLGRAALALDRNDPSACLSILEPLLQRLSSASRTERAAVLELIVPAQVREGQQEAAAAALAQLDDTATTVGTPPLLASAGMAAGTLAVAHADLVRARLDFALAAERFERADLPFESGRARIALARVLLELGAPVEAAAEAKAARAALDTLGARHEAARAGEVLDSAAVAPVSRPPASPSSPSSRGATPSAALTPRQREVLALIAQGLSDRAVGKRLYLSEYTIHRHVSNILDRLRVPSRSAAIAVAVRQGLV